MARLLVVAVVALHLSQPADALKFPAFFSSWMQPQVQLDGARGSPLIEQSAGQAQPLAQDDSMMASSSSYEASRIVAPQQLAAGNGQQVTGKKSALHSFLMLPGKHNQLHLFSGLPRGLFGRLLTPSAAGVASSASSSAIAPLPQQTQAYLGNPLLSWNQQSPVSHQQQMYDSSRLNAFASSPVSNHYSAGSQRAPVVGSPYRDNRLAAQKHALGFGEPHEFNMLDRPVSVSHGQPQQVMQQQQQLNQRPTSHNFQQHEELPQQLVIISADSASELQEPGNLNNSSSHLEESRANGTLLAAMDEFITTLRPAGQQSAANSSDLFQKEPQLEEPTQDAAPARLNNAPDTQKASPRPLESGQAPTSIGGNLRNSAEQNADGLESSAAAIIVAPSEQVDVGPTGELASEEQMDSFILGPYKGHLMNAHELLGESQPLREYQAPPQTHLQQQQQQQQQLHLLAPGKPPQQHQQVVAAYGSRPLLSTSSLASSLIQQAKNLIHLPFAHMSSANPISGDPLRTAGSATNSLFRGQVARGQLMQLEAAAAAAAAASAAPARKEKFLNIGQLSAMQHQPGGEQLGQPTNYRPSFYNGLHDNRALQQQQHRQQVHHFQHQSTPPQTAANRLTAVGAGAGTKGPFYSTPDSGYFLMAQNQAADTGARQQQQQQQPSHQQPHQQLQQQQQQQLSLPPRFHQPATQFEFGLARQQPRPQQQPQPYVPYFVDYTQGAPRQRPQQVAAAAARLPESTFAGSQNLLSSFQFLRQPQPQQSARSPGAAAANLQSGLYQVEAPRSAAGSRLHKQLMQQQQQQRPAVQPISQQLDNMFAGQQQQQQMADGEAEAQEQELEQSLAQDQLPAKEDSEQEQVTSEQSLASETPSAKQVAASIGVAQVNNSSSATTGHQRRPGKVFNVPMTSASELKSLRLSQDITLYDLEGSAEVRQEPGKPQVGFLDTEVHTLPYMLSMQPTTGRVQHAPPPPPATRYLHFSHQAPLGQSQQQVHNSLPLGRFPLGYLAPPPPPPAAPAQSPFEALYQELGISQAPFMAHQQQQQQRALPGGELSGSQLMQQQQAINYDTNQRGEHQFVLAIDHLNGSPHQVSSLLASSMVAPGSASDQQSALFTSSAPMATTAAAAAAAATTTGGVLIEASTSAAPPSSFEPQPSAAAAATTTRLPGAEENSATTDSSSQDANGDSNGSKANEPSFSASGEPSSPSVFCQDRAPGLYADEAQRCKAYYQCAPTGHQMFRCNNHTQFNQKTQNCDWWYNVNCGGQQQAPEQSAPGDTLQSTEKTHEEQASSQDRVPGASSQDISNFKHDNRWTVAPEDSVHSLSASSDSPTAVAAPAETTSFSPQTTGGRQEPLPASQSTPVDANELTVRLDAPSTTEIAPSTGSQLKATDGAASASGLQVGALAPSDAAGESTRLTPGGAVSSSSSSATSTSPLPASTTQKDDAAPQISLNNEQPTSSTQAAAAGAELESTSTGSSEAPAGELQQAIASQKPKRLVQSEFGLGAKQAEPEASARAAQRQTEASLYSTSAISEQRSTAAAAAPEVAPRRRYERRYGERLTKT